MDSEETRRPFEEWHELLGVAPKDVPAECVRLQAASDETTKKQFPSGWPVGFLCTKAEYLYMLGSLLQWAIGLSGGGVQTLNKVGSKV